MVGSLPAASYLLNDVWLVRSRLPKSVSRVKVAIEENCRQRRAAVQGVVKLFWCGEAVLVQSRFEDERTVQGT